MATFVCNLTNFHCCKWQNIGLTFSPSGHTAPRGNVGKCTTMLNVLRTLVQDEPSILRQKYGNNSYLCMTSTQLCRKITRCVFYCVANIFKASMIVNCSARVFMKSSFLVSARHRVVNYDCRVSVGSTTDGVKPSSTLPIFTITYIPHTRSFSFLCEPLSSLSFSLSLFPPILLFFETSEDQFVLCVSSLKESFLGSLKKEKKPFRAHFL